MGKGYCGHTLWGWWKCVFQHHLCYRVVNLTGCWGNHMENGGRLPGSHDTDLCVIYSAVICRLFSLQCFLWAAAVDVRAFTCYTVYLAQVRCKPDVNPNSHAAITDNDVAAGKHFALHCDGNWERKGDAEGLHTHTFTHVCRISLTPRRGRICHLKPFHSLSDRPAFPADVIWGQFFFEKTERNCSYFKPMEELLLLLLISSFASCS